MLGQKKRQIVYEEWLKKASIEKVLSGEMNLSEAGRHFGIKGKSLLAGWIKEFKLLSKGGLFEKRKIKSVALVLKDVSLSNMTKEEQRAFQSLKQELAELRQSEALWRVKATACETLVEVAEEALSMPVGSLRKKYGAKQSKGSKDDCPK